jgi:hypothetical protein
MVVQGSGPMKAFEKGLRVAEGAQVNPYLIHLVFTLDMENINEDLAAKLRGLYWRQKGTRRKFRGQMDV